MPLPFVVGTAHVPDTDTGGLRAPTVPFLFPVGQGLWQSTNVSCRLHSTTISVESRTRHLAKISYFRLGIWVRNHDKGIREWEWKSAANVSGATGISVRDSTIGPSRRTFPFCKVGVLTLFPSCCISSCVLLGALRSTERIC